MGGPLKCLLHTTHLWLSAVAESTLRCKVETGVVLSPGEDWVALSSHRDSDFCTIALEYKDSAGPEGSTGVEEESHVPAGRGEHGTTLL